MCNRKTFLVLIPLVAFLVWKVRDQLDIGKELHFTDSQQSCTRIDIPGGGSEDVTLYKNGIALISSGPLLEAFEEPTTTDVSKAGIYAIDLNLKQKKVVALKTKGVPSTIRVLPHGFFYSSRSEKLYVINHGFEKGGSAVLVFDVIPPREGDRFPSLNYYRTVQSDKFPIGLINDLAEGGEGEILVSRCLAVPLPIAGRYHPADWKEAIAIKFAEVTPILPLTHVVRCRFSGKEDTPICDIVAPGLHLANGVNVNADRTEVYVVDVFTKKLNFYTRNSSGLTFSHNLALPHAGDNVEVDPENGDLYVGSIPSLYITLQAMKDYKNPSHVPGAVTRIRKDSSGQYTLIDDIVMHDGSKMSQVSAGFKYGNGVLLGSPLTSAVMWCEL